MNDGADVTSAWRRLSPWSILHFASKAVIQNVQALIFAGPATYGAARWGASEIAYIVPIAIIVLVIFGALVTFWFYAYRVLEDSIQVRRGALFKQNLNLSFERIQNISIEHPFYFRPLGRSTLRIDGAGSKAEEVNIPALAVTDAEAVRRFILGRKHEIGSAAVATTEGLPVDSDEGTSEQAFFDRSLSDLIIHGLTNNRSFLLIAAAFGFLSQSSFSPADIAEWLGIDFDVIIGGYSIVRLLLLAVLSLLAAIGIIALLSVLVSIFAYFGFAMYRTRDGLIIKRGLLTRHEIHVKKSRIQTVTLRQDWLDFLLARRNIILERLSHGQSQEDPWAQQRKRILVPSVRLGETSIVTNEVFPGCRFDDLPFTPIKLSYFLKRAAIASVLYAIALSVSSVVLPDSAGWAFWVIATLWPLHITHAYLSWRRGGLAVHEGYIVARSGTIGIDYRIFPAYKAQDVTHVQSVLMRLRGTSSLVFHTASTTIRVPHMPSDFMKSVADYCVFQVESSPKSWM